MGVILKVFMRSIPRAAPLLALLEPRWLCGAGRSQGLIAQQGFLPIPCFITESMNN